MVSVLFYLLMGMANLLALSVATRQMRGWVRRTLPDWWPDWHLRLMFWLACVTVLLYDIVMLLEAAD